MTSRKPDDIPAFNREMISYSANYREESSLGLLNHKTGEEQTGQSLTFGRFLLGAMMGDL